MADPKFDYCDVIFSVAHTDNTDSSKKVLPEPIIIHLDEGAASAIARHASLMDHGRTDAAQSIFEISGLTTGSILAALHTSDIQTEFLQKLSSDISRAARSGLLIARLTQDYPKKDFRVCLNPRPFGPLIFPCSPRKIDLQSFLGIDAERPECEFVVPAADVISRIASTPQKAMREAPRSAKQTLVAALDASFRSSYSTVHGAPALNISITS
ncbi:hypothetical protein [Acetobacter persici]|uniref:Uncharacterized protein n=1 Tax=Acetobacter persici TaxID=1076596 RepID=A0A1U9LJ94_9PROT|nr:hypothetical protein [Acetobacter persici]AQT06492.1 hypothetical protein A0U91_15895 [Acetobacter persici]